MKIRLKRLLNNNFLSFLLLKKFSLYEYLKVFLLLNFYFTLKSYMQPLDEYILLKGGSVYELQRIY